MYSLECDDVLRFHFIPLVYINKSWLHYIISTHYVVKSIHHVVVSKSGEKLAQGKNWSHGTVSGKVTEMVCLSPDANSRDRHKSRNRVISGSKMYFKLLLVLDF